MASILRVNMYIALIVILNEIETCKETHVCEIVSE